MQRYFLLFTAMLSLCSLRAQDTETIQKEIDRQVWKPFKEAFENADAEKLNATYAEEVLRVTPQKIDTGNEFKGQNLTRFRQNKESGTEIKLDFWFDSRHTNEDTSYEVGFYRIGFRTNGKESIVYGQFHIVLKKVDGQWKITQDWDTTTINGNEITAADFARKPPAIFK
ncbi:DUF4440 domain-containing protein [Leptobacterium flavescens]|uniref:DUF4440 domain-containing protein n=1 Tax=Leptobacterium flavescens TaxID=472055 RepID=A0A6P0UQ34_9FLAO|nr:nuclear transport factor 2 family protein [Leptobacterium flavescens]NER15245.1 DUF4440 domain-containing protein [Leptobacterium flavescens]